MEKVFSWHERQGAISRLTPPWAPLKLISREGDGVKKGVRVTFRIRLFNISLPWVAEHIDYTENKEFIDKQVKGPFSFWRHTHRFIPAGDHDTVMEDRVEFNLPLGILSLPFYGYAKKEFERMFRYRHRVLKQDLESSLANSPRKRILISGSSGAIGSALIPFLQTSGHEVIRLVRHNDGLKKGEIFWDPYKEILDLDGAGPIDAVINLNGLDISRGRWTKNQKRAIIDSRVIPTRFLVKKMKSLKKKPEVYISSSAIGYYGEGKDQILTESSPLGRCFISHVCRQWEDASKAAKDAGIRTVQLRIGVVLTPAGGALARMLLPFRTGLGVTLSHGSQYMSWISMDDTLSGILHIIQHNTLRGAVNLTAPNPVTNREFSKTLARIFSKRVFIRFPQFLVRLLWGKMGEETLLTSARVKPEKLLNSGYVFRHETILRALCHVTGKEKTDE